MVLAVVLALLAWGAADASAEVTVESARAVVSTSGAAATIAFHPFRISFQDGGGRTVLGEVPNSEQQPAPVPPTVDPLPLGSQLAPPPTIYAPLTFMVGGGRSVQYPGTNWEGDQLAGTQGGIQYSARDVISATPQGEGVRLLVSTSDPTGRQLAVIVSPGPGAAIHVTATPTTTAGVATIGDSFGSTADEAFHGFGGRHNALDERGQDFYNWIEQENFGAGEGDPAIAASPGSGGHSYLFPNGPTAAYYVQSLFYSSHPYGFLLNNPELSRFRLDSDRPDAWNASVASTTLDYTVAPGAAPQAIATLTAISGRHRTPPAWGVGPQLDRLVRVAGETPASYMQNVDDDIAHIAHGDIHVSAYRIEGWNYYDPAALRSVIDRLHALGVKALVYFRAFVDKSSSNEGTDSPTAFDEATAGGYMAKTAAGAPYLFVSNFNVPAALIDFTNPAAVRWWDGRLAAALDAGADGFMEDFGEQTQVDMQFSDGETGATMHNRYPTIYHRVTRDFLDAYERAHPGRRTLVYVRAGWNGSAGSEQSNFPGDETTDWSRSSGLASQTTDMLNRAVGGAYGFTTDIGGYNDVGPYPATTKELFLRWAEWAALSPMFRLHGSDGAGTHTPWSFDAETVSLYRQITALHERAEPLILRLWAEADRTGMPVTRPLWLAYPGDPNAAAQDQEWLLGPDVLVAPVVTEGARSRPVYFPAGCWRSATTGTAYAGGRTYDVPAPLAELPYFFRCGATPFADAGRATPGRCVDTRRFSFLIHQPHGGGRIVRVFAYVNGRLVRTVRGRRVTRLVLARLPVGRFRVRIVAVSNSGARTVSVRTYRGCRKGRPHTRVVRPPRRRPHRSGR